MNCLNVNKCKFNWDDIDIGNNHLNHSENFFAEKHIQHERFNNLELLSGQMASVGLDSEDKENTLPAIGSPINITNLQIIHPTTPAVNIDSSEANIPKEEKQSPEDKKEAMHYETPKTKKPPANIVCKFSSIKKNVHKGAVSKSMRPPQAYDFKDKYEQNKKKAAIRRLEEERKMREFHSRPAPNFDNYHQQMLRKQVKHVVTVPVTPNVLKKSRESEEKKQKKLDDIKRQNEAPKIRAREATVLKEQPFVPKKTSTVIQTRPFNLRSELRLQERKQYDIAFQRSLEEKHKQVQNDEEERKKLEEERIRELRKLATFKARPNPFK